MFIAACGEKNPSPVGAAFVETVLQNTVKIPKLTPMVRFPNRTYWESPLETYSVQDVFTTYSRA